MEGFTESDRERMLESLRMHETQAARVLELRREVSARFDQIEAAQRKTMRRQRTVAPVDRIAEAIEARIKRRWLLVLGAGMVLGSAIGGATGEVVRKMVQLALGVR